MRKTFRQTVAIGLVMCIALSFSISSYASDNPSPTSQPLGIGAKSEIYPDAYIEIDNGNQKALRNGEVLLSGASVAVYYENIYGRDAQGNTIIVDSRLLSKEEVDAIGKENFEMVSPFSPAPREVSSSRGKLLIRMDGSYSISGNTLTAFYSAVATWSSGGGLLDPDAAGRGADIAGFYWGGQLGQNGTSTSGTYSDGTSVNIYGAGGTPNAAQSWYFDELSPSLVNMKRASFDIHLKKANMTGNGNTTEIHFKYIHTYQTYTVSGNISTSSAGITLNNVDKQWPLDIWFYGLPY